MDKKNLLKAITATIVYATLLGACTTVKTFDAQGNMLGKCRVTGFPWPSHGRCEGNANGGAPR